MVEEDHGDVLAIARLELLSNTAMLKKVLDKKRGGPGDDSSPRAVDMRNDGVTTARDTRRPYHLEAQQQQQQQQHPSTLVARPPSTSMNDEMMRREQAVLHHTGSMEDAAHDISPHSYDPPRYAPPASVPGPVYHFNTASSPRDCPPQMHGRPSPYPGEAPGVSSYVHGPHGEAGLYFLENGRLDTSPVGGGMGGGPHISPHHHIHGGGHRPPYLKENVPPHRYRHHPSTMYGQRSSMERLSRMPESAGMYGPPPSDHISPPRSDETIDAMRYDGLARENLHMREQLKEKDVVVSSLQQRVAYLEKQISELRNLPTGKISHIPIDDMIRIMQEYGSEVSNQTLPKRKKDIKKASIVRQFRRWNPEFFRYFVHLNGEWVPKLGKEGEMKRRVEKRRLYKKQGGQDKDDMSQPDSYDS